MKAWRMSKPGEAPILEEIPTPAVRPGAVLVRMRATPLLSYLGRYLAGTLPYQFPPMPFTPGTNGVGVIEAVGGDLYHLSPGQRVVVSPHYVTRENVDDPGQILIGLTASGPASKAIQSDWRDGTLAEYALFPASCVTPVEGADDISDDLLATAGKFLVPLGGLLRGRLAGGETLIVSGASGYFGSAAVLLGVALGAARVIATGRNLDALQAVATAADSPRVIPVRVTGDVNVDRDAIRQATAGGAHIALDLLGRAGDASATTAVLRSLRRGGRLVLMGSMTVPLPVTYGELLGNDWEIIGNFMYRPEAVRRLLALVASGQLRLDAVRLRTFELAALPAAIEAAAGMRGLDCTLVTMT
jgi:alcohol dehydrogenase